MHEYEAEYESGWISAIFGRWSFFVKHSQEKTIMQLESLGVQ